MPVRDVLRYPHPALKRVARELEPEEGTEAARVASDLLDTMRAHPGCVGLAAPQLDEPVRVVVVDVSEHPKAQTSNGQLLLVNPVVVRARGAHVAREGCLSIPHLTANVRRATHIGLEARTPAGEAVALESEGFEARCLLHEIDHLDGVLFLDRVDSLSRDVFRRKRFAQPPGSAAEPAAAELVGRAVSRITQALGAGDLAGALAKVAVEELEVRVPADLPEPGPFRGRAEVAGFLAAVAESWDELRIDVEAIVAATDDRAVARLRLSGRGSGSGVEAAGLLVGAFVLEGGRVARVALFRRDAEALREVGLDEPGPGPPAATAP